MEETWKNKIAIQLLRSIFRVYLVLAVVVTIVQLKFEFENTKNEVLKELKSIEKSFKPTMAKGLWDMDFESMESATKGLMSNLIIQGIRIEDATGTFKKIVGEVQEDKQYKILEKPIPLTFHLIFKDGQKDQAVGQVTIYSNEKVVVNRVKYGLILILVNSLIKTFLLWIIMIYFVRKILGHPIEHFTQQVLTLDPKNLIRIRFEEDKKNEISTLGSAFNKMIDKQNENKEELDKYQNHLEELVQKRTKELEKEVNKSKNLLYILTHDIANLISYVSFNVDRTVKDQSNVLDPKYLKKLKKSKDGSNKIISLIEKIKFLNAYEDESITFDLSNQSLPNLVDEVMKTLEKKLATKNITLKKDFDKNGDQVLVNEKHFKDQVLHNVIDNAIRFSSPGSTLEISTKRINNKVVLSIKNRGEVIPEKIKDHLFDPYTRSVMKDTEGQKGTGLGLVMCKKALEKQNDSIEIFSPVTNEIDGAETNITLKAA